jgi:hypothetical protein
VGDVGGVPVGAGGVGIVRIRNSLPTGYGVFNDDQGRRYLNLREIQVKGD